MRRTVPFTVCLLAFVVPVPADADPFTLARQNAVQANEALRRCQRFVHAWLAHADERTGLIPRNLTANRDLWNAQDAAADNYPFMVLTAALLDKRLFRTRMQEMLIAETDLTSRVDRLPDDYSFSKQGFHYDEPEIGRIIFGSSEYIKDGLLPLTEWLGASPWCDRMLGIMDDIWKHAPVESRFGRIPSTSHEINGEMLQALSRVYWMTGRKEYLEYALRLADYYLLDHLPTQEESLRLRDHGCEILSGLAEVYVAASFAAPDRKKAYEGPIHAMFDRVLEVARNEHGMFYNIVNPRTGEVLNRGCCDTWGYTYNGVYAVYMIDKTPAYREAVRQALGNLYEHYRSYPWHPTVVADEYADSVEGAINLFNREPVASAADWIDSEIRVMFDVQKPDGIIEGWHGDGNFARTAIMYALWKTQGVTIEPWRGDVLIGAVQREGVLYVSLKSTWPWQGRIVLDRPRHATNMKLPIDYPRINQFPEWFTVRADSRYRVSNGDESGTMAGRELQDGLPVELTMDVKVLNLTVALAE